MNSMKGLLSLHAPSHALNHDKIFIVDVHAIMLTIRTNILDTDVENIMQFVFGETEEEDREVENNTTAKALAVRVTHTTVRATQTAVSMSWKNT